MPSAGGFLLMLCIESCFFKFVLAVAGPIFYKDRIYYNISKYYFPMHIFWNYLFYLFVLIYNFLLTE